LLPLPELGLDRQGVSSWSPGSWSSRLANNTKERLASSPELDQQVHNAIMDALLARTTMSKQILDCERAHQGL
jgi:hypothetical protein